MPTRFYDYIPIPVRIAGIDEPLPEDFITSIKSPSLHDIIYNFRTAYTLTLEGEEFYGYLGKPKDNTMVFYLDDDDVEFIKEMLKERKRNNGEKL